MNCEVGDGPPQCPGGMGVHIGVQRAQFSRQASQLGQRPPIAFTLSSQASELKSTATLPTYSNEESNYFRGNLYFHHYKEEMRLHSWRANG